MLQPDKSSFIGLLGRSFDFWNCSAVRYPAGMHTWSTQWVIAHGTEELLQPQAGDISSRKGTVTPAGGNPEGPELAGSMATIFTSTRTRATASPKSWPATLSGSQSLKRRSINDFTRPVYWPVLMRRGVDYWQGGLCLTNGGPYSISEPKTCAKDRPNRPIRLGGVSPPGLFGPIGPFRAHSPFNPRELHYVDKIISRASHATPATLC